MHHNNSFGPSLFTEDSYVEDINQKTKISMNDTNIINIAPHLNSSLHNFTNQEILMFNA